MSTSTPTTTTVTTVHPTVAGLRVIENLLTCERETELLAAVDSEPWSCVLKRRTQHYGYAYDYTTRTLPTRLGPLPVWSNDVVDALVAAGVFSETARPNQLIVNEYLPGQGIAPHVDSNVFGEPIVSVSLGSAIVMTLSRPGYTDVGVTLPRRSALILTGQARSVWRHSIAARKTDVINQVRQDRSRRVSLTFRIVPVTNKS